MGTIDKFDEVYAINNSVRFFKTKVIHHVSTDFYDSNKPIEQECKKFIVKTIKGTNLKTPLRIYIEGQTTMFVETCCHIFNLYGFGCKVYVIGCDYDYEGEKTHFYGKGGLDPFRMGRNILSFNLKILNCLGIFYNISDNPRTMLPFPKVDYSLIK